MKLINIPSKLSEFDKFIKLINDVPNIIYRLFDDTNNNYVRIALMLGNQTASLQNIQRYYSLLICNYEKTIEETTRKARLYDLLDKEEGIVKRFRENSIMFINLDVQFTYINTLWSELEELIENNEIDASDATQLNLLIHITSFLIFFLGILKYIHPDFSIIIELLDYIYYCFVDIKSDVVLI